MRNSLIKLALCSSVATVSGFVNIVSSFCAEATEFRIKITVLKLGDVLLGGGVSTVAAVAGAVTSVGGVSLVDRDAAADIEGLRSADVAANLLGSDLEAASVGGRGSVELNVGEHFFAGGAFNSRLSSVEVQRAVAISIADNTSILQVGAVTS